LPRLALIPAARSARHAPPHRSGRAVRASPGRQHLPEPRAPAAAATARLLPRVHRRDARLRRPRRATHRRRRRPAGGVRLHRRPLPQFPQGRSAMNESVELRSVLADRALAGVYVVEAAGTSDFLAAAMALDFAAVTVNLAGCGDRDEAL